MEYISEYLTDYFFKQTYKKYQQIPNIKSKNYNDEIRMRIIEKTIARIIMDNPHPNVVKIYSINNDFIEMEYVDTKYLIVPNVIDLLEAKKFFQSKGIVYIDWKYDNIGLGTDGKFKVFDFDCAGLVDPTNPDNWIFEPVNYYAYRDAISNGYSKPFDIDDYCFVKEFAK